MKTIKRYVARCDGESVMDAIRHFESETDIDKLGFDSARDAYAHAVQTCRFNETVEILKIQISTLMHGRLNK